MSLGCVVFVHKATKFSQIFAFFGKYIYITVQLTTL